MTLDPTPFPLDHLALRGAPGAPALTVGEVTIDYAALDDAVGRTAAELLRRGLQPGDRVASWMAKTMLACVLPLATARAGLVHVPINPVLKRAQVAHILGDSGARLLIANAARLESLEPGDLGAARPVALEAWLAPGPALPRSSNDPRSLVALLYTSGSTGRPKGVMLTHANLWLGAVSVAHYLGLAAEDRTLGVLPLAFDYGQNQFLAAWASGGCAVAFDYLLPRDVVAAVRRHDVTVLAGVPPLWSQLVEQEWGDAGASLRTLTNSGGHLSEPVVRRLRQLMPQARLHLMYGLTEAFRSASLDPELVDEHPDSVGTAIPFANVRIARPDGSDAGPVEEGELVHSGPLVAAGYWNDPERTAQRFRDGEVWSGDRMTRGADGLLRFRGRDDAMMKVSGHRVSPTEIEEAALASGAVREAVAIGIPDERNGHAIILFVSGGGDDETLRSHLKRALPAHMQPARIDWRDRLPLGPNGKIDRALLEAGL